MNHSVTPKWNRAASIVVVIVLAVILAAPSIQRSIFYPKPRGLPSVVGQTTEQLLARLQTLLETNAPIVASALQPGLTDTQIAALESQGGFRLSEDIRALYRWHNGIAKTSTIGLLAGERFVPLDEVVQERSIVGQQVASRSGVQRAAFSVFAGHRKDWIQVLDDGGGDGYFYDPMRTDAEGAFFYYFGEIGHYLWFPSVRNFLAGVIECYESRAVRIGSDGKSLEEDFDRTQKIWERFAKSRD
jgi:cell wall assembly regulator SMI1